MWTEKSFAVNEHRAMMLGPCLVALKMTAEQFDEMFHSPSFSLETLIAMNSMDKQNKGSGGIESIPQFNQDRVIEQIQRE